MMIGFLFLFPLRVFKIPASIEAGSKATSFCVKISRSVCSSMAVYTSGLGFRSGLVSLIAVCSRTSISALWDSKMSAVVLPRGI